MIKAYLSDRRGLKVAGVAKFVDGRFETDDSRIIRVMEDYCDTHTNVVREDPAVTEKVLADREKAQAAAQKLADEAALK